jgi:hypothetical protein
VCPGTFDAKAGSAGLIDWAYASGAPWIDPAQLATDIVATGHIQLLTRLLPDRT